MMVDGQPEASQVALTAKKGSILVVTAVAVVVVYVRCSHERNLVCKYVTSRAHMLLYDIWL